jgi:hypothetical protein
MVLSIELIRKIHANRLDGAESALTVFDIWWFQMLNRLS